jgi:FG-GAP-like repeat
MAAINWKSPVNGDWNVAANWSTNTVPTLADAATISAFGPYIVTISSADFANTLTFGAPSAALVENSGSLTMGGALAVNSGFVSLNKANTIGSVALSGGVLAFGNGGALGAGAISMSGGELLGAASETLSNALTFSGTSTIAAAHGTMLSQTGFVTINANSTLNFGALGQDGVVVWKPSGYSITTPFTFNVVAGTLKAANSFLSGMISFGAQPTTVDAGATLDLGGFGLTTTNLLGGGAVTDSGAATTLTLGAANFSGAISGPLSLIANGAVVLSGANTYTGTTTINTADSLQIGAGGTGSIGAGAISDAGTLTIDVSNAITLAGPISGAGNLDQFGTGVTSINSANTYTGGTQISGGGTLAIGNGAALGTGRIYLTGGELLGTASETLINELSISGTTTIAAAHGTTLNETGFIDLSANSTLNFGAVGQDGVVVWKPSGYSISTPFTFNVVAGTLKAANSFLSGMISFGAQPTTVDAGATLDLGGFSLSTTNLLGAGAVTDSGASATLILGAANFSGSISGALSVVFNGAASLSGLEDYSGGATLNGTTTVANSGTYDIVANANISGTPVTSFINNGLFEKTGGGGISDVTSDFVNNGELNVLSGKVEFSGGFTNNGVIHGLVTQSGGVTTISAPVPSDFNGDALSDILWRNTNGDTQIWNSNGSAGFTGEDLGVVGSDWQISETADFNGDGKADILWRNTNGDTQIWNSNGSAGFSGQDLGVVPTSWQIAGTGDFNGSGADGILWRDSSSGDVELWNANGAGGFTGQDLGVVPSSWQISETADFNGDGKADILWRNSNGDVMLWNSNGSAGFSGQDLGVVPTSWQIAGTGDFNGSGADGILWRNSSSGDVGGFRRPGPRAGLEQFQDPVGVGVRSKS